VSIRDIQQDVSKWSKQNFPADEVGGAVDEQTMRNVMRLIQHVGRASHKVLKAEQSIRDGLSNLNTFNGEQIAGQVACVINYVRRDFGRHTLADHMGDAYRHINPVDEEWQHKLLGVIEECGELVEAINDGTDAEVRDALGDIFIFLCDLASSLDVDLQDAIGEALDEVLERDWTDEGWSRKEVEEEVA